MITKSVRLTEEEAAALEEFVALTGEVEAQVLKRSFLRGLAEERLDRAIVQYIGGATTGEAAKIAGLPRAVLLYELTQRGVPLLSYRQGDAEAMARALEVQGSTRAAEVVRQVAAELAQEERGIA